MDTITIETIEAKQAELNALIAKFKEQPHPKVIKINGRTLELQPGERYAGALLDENGGHLHDVIVLAARTEDDYTFKGAQQWAQSVGGDAPSPEECALIEANCPGLITRCIWTNKVHEDNAAFAWIFIVDGTTDYEHKGALGGALAIRRV